MKNLIIILLFSFAFTIANAQTSLVMTNGLATDTVTNAATKTGGVKLTDGFDRVSIQGVITKISGTVAGAVTVQGSLDGTNYVTVDSSVVVNGFKLKKPTFTATDVASQTFIFVIDKSPYLYYRISYTGSGTMSAKLSGKIIGRKN